MLCLSLSLAFAPFPAGAEDLSIPRAIQPALVEAKAHLVEQPLATIPLADKIERFGHTVADPDRRAVLLGTADWLRAEVALRTNRLADADRLLQRGRRSISAVSQPTKLRGDILMSLGTLFLMQDRAADALGSFQQAYRAFDAIHETRSQSIALQNIGALYSSAHDGNRAERYYKQAALIHGDDPLLSLALHNSRGNVLLDLRRYREAEAEYEAAASAARKLGKPILEARVLDNLARNQIESNELRGARKTLNRAFQLVDGADTIGLTRLLNATAAKLAQRQGDLQRAAALIGKTFAGVNPERTPPDFRTPHLFAYSIYRQLGDDRRALIHLEALKRLSDEAAKVATTNSAALMAARFDYANQELTIQRLTTEQLRKAAEVQRTLFLLSGGATMVVIALLTLGLITIRRSRNQVQAANAVLASTNGALEKALQAKTEFLATTSHEIRTPLNGILGMTQVMLADSALAPAARERVQVVHGAGLTMRALVDDILDVAKMETGNLTVDPVAMQLSPLLHEVAQLWTEQARTKGIAFHLDIGTVPDWIVSDPGRLRQVIFNLLSNAIKFTAAGSVSLRAATIESPAAPDGGRLEIAVQDTGIGIPAEKLEEIFESFRQADSSTTREYGGTGLGLTICRNLAHALGGDIRVTSAVGEGSCFTLTLPLSRAEAPTPAAPSNAAAMLIVERNPIVRAMLRRLFEAQMGIVHAVGTVEEALDVAASGIAAVLIDDAALGDLDNALEILRKLRGLLPCSTIAVLAGDAGEEKKMQFLDAGATQVIDKPIAGDRLVALAAPPCPQFPDGVGKDPLVSQAA